MRVEVFATAAEMQRASAWAWLEQALNDVPGVMGIATGTTTAPIYEVIAQLYALHPFDTSRLVLCALDDYLGLPQGHIASCSERIRRQLVGPLGLSPSQLLIPDEGQGEQAPAAYEQAIEAAGGIKLQVLGLGEDAHLGFCRPGTALASMAHRVRLAPQSREMLRDSYGLPEGSLPEYGLTLGLGSIMKARELLVVATGRRKAEAVAASIRGPISEAVPASVLQLHHRVRWLLDREAASLLG